MPKQLITINPAGLATSLHVKGGLDLRAFGLCQIRRSSLIEFHGFSQRFYVNLLGGRFKGPVCHSTADFLAVPLPESATVAPDGRVLFEKYEEAVAFEVDIIQSARKQYGSGAVA